MEYGRKRKNIITYLGIIVGRQKCRKRLRILMVGSSIFINFK
jgi:hypothetical protein